MSETASQPFSTPQFTGGERPITPLQLRALCAKDNAQALRRVLPQYGLMLATGGLIALVDARYGIGWAVPLMLVQAYMIAFQFMVVHETAHKTAFRTRWLNALFGHISGVAIALPYEYYTLFHWDHHRYTQDVDKDPELLFKTVPTSWLKLLFTISGVSQLFKRLLLTLRHALTGKVTAPWIPPEKRPLIVAEARLHIAIYLLLLAGSLYAGSAILLWAWLLPLLIGQLMLRPYLLSEHTGCATTRSAFENTRTTYTNGLMHWFAWNMPYHVEHHAYPSVPFHALPQLNALIDARIVHKGQGYSAVVPTVWRILRARSTTQATASETSR